MRELSFALIVVALFAALVYAAPRKHDCSPALIRAIDDAIQMLSAEGNIRLADALDRAATAECKEPK